MSIKDLFPEIKFQNTYQVQFRKIGEEVSELEREVEQTEINRDNMLVEAIDVMHATANFLYKAGYSEQDIMEAIYQVKDKNTKRGYYVGTAPCEDLE